MPDARVSSRSRRRSPPCHRRHERAGRRTERFVPFAPHVDRCNARRVRRRPLGMAPPFRAGGRSGVVVVYVVFSVTRVSSSSLASSWKAHVAIECPTPAHASLIVPRGVLRRRLPCGDGNHVNSSLSTVNRAALHVCAGRDVSCHPFCRYTRTSYTRARSHVHPRWRRDPRGKGVGVGRHASPSRT